MLSTDGFLAMLRAASLEVDGCAADELRRIVAAWTERQRRRTEGVAIGPQAAGFVCVRPVSPL